MREYGLLKKCCLLAVGNVSFCKFSYFSQVLLTCFTIRRSQKHLPTSDNCYKWSLMALRQLQVPEVSITSIFCQKPRQVLAEAKPLFPRRAARAMVDGSKRSHGQRRPERTTWKLPVRELLLQQRRPRQPLLYLRTSVFTGGGRFLLFSFSDRGQDFTTRGRKKERACLKGSGLGERARARTRVRANKQPLGQAGRAARGRVPAHTNVFGGSWAGATCARRGVPQLCGLLGRSRVSSERPCLLHGAAIAATPPWAHTGRPGLRIFVMLDSV